MQIRLVDRLEGMQNKTEQKLRNEQITKHT